MFFGFRSFYITNVAFTIQLERKENTIKVSKRIENKSPEITEQKQKQKESKVEKLNDGEVDDDE